MHPNHSFTAREFVPAALLGVVLLCALLGPLDHVLCAQPFLLTQILSPVPRHICWFSHGPACLQTEVQL